MAAAYIESCRQQGDALPSGVEATEIAEASA